jgi:hypothetical protein
VLAANGDDTAQPRHREQHHQVNWLRDVILGDQAEQAREAAEIDATPDAERQEIRDICAAKGFSGELLDRVADTITGNRESWLAAMMDEELPSSRCKPPTSSAARS